MAKPLISEVLQGLTEVKGKELHKARVAYLKSKDSVPLRDVLRINFDEAYQVVFLEEPAFKNLDYKENFWINKLKSDINLAKTQYSDI